MRAEEEALSQQAAQNQPNVRTEKIVNWGSVVDTRNKREDETNVEFAARIAEERKSGTVPTDVNKDAIGQPVTVGGGEHTAREETEEETEEEEPAEEEIQP